MDSAAKPKEVRKRVDYSAPVYTIDGAIICPFTALIDKRLNMGVEGIEKAIGTLFDRSKAVKDVGCEEWKKGQRIELDPLGGDRNGKLFARFSDGLTFAVAWHLTNNPSGEIDYVLAENEPQDMKGKLKPDAPLYGKNPVAKIAPPTTPAPNADIPASSDLNTDHSDATEVNPFIYWVQVGAYRTPEDAETQHAKLSLSGIDSKVSESEQSGRMVYRVRVGPFDKKEEGEMAKENLDKSGLDTALVRVRR